MRVADSAERDMILRLASDPSLVRVDRHATGNMMAWDLTIDDVREAICKAISDGMRVKVTSVDRHPKGLVGQPAYAIKPQIGCTRFYIRMAVFRIADDQDNLLVISVHPD